MIKRKNGVTCVEHIMVCMCAFIFLFMCPRRTLLLKQSTYFRCSSVTISHQIEVFSRSVGRHEAFGLSDVVNTEVNCVS